MREEKVFCVVPAYNEEKNIEKVLQNLASIVYGIVVVVDGGTDNTFERALLAKEKLKEENNNIFILKHLINRGQGASLQTGNDFSLKKGADVVVHFDADGQFQYEDIEPVVSPVLKDEVDVVFGSRFLGKKSNIPWFKKNIVFRLAHIFNYIFAKIVLSDPQSGFRAMNRKALFLIKIDQDKMAHCSEIIFKVAQSKLRYKEVPITVLYNEYGQKFSGGVKIIKDLVFSRIFK